MGTIRLLVTPSQGMPVVHELPDGPEYDDKDVSEVLGLIGGERIQLLPCVEVEPGRAVEIRDLGEF